MICNKCNDEVIVLTVCSGGVLQEVYMARSVQRSPKRGPGAEQLRGVKGSPKEL